MNILEDVGVDYSFNHINLYSRRYCAVTILLVLLFDIRVVQQIDFVLHQDGGYVPDLHLHFLPPAADGFKGLSVGGGEDQHTGLSACRTEHASHTRSSSAKHTSTAFLTLSPL